MCDDEEFEDDDDVIYVKSGFHFTTSNVALIQSYDKMMQARKEYHIASGVFLLSVVSLIVTVLWTLKG